MQINDDWAEPTSKLKRGSSNGNIDETGPDDHLVRQIAGVLDLCRS
jgi:hypothetical protein